MEPVIYSTYLKEKGDKKHQMFLTTDKLVVIFKGDIQVYYRSNILKLAIASKKLIMPLVIGGIGASFSIIATSMGWYDREYNLMLSLLFFGVMYYGYVGKEALEVFEKGSSSIYLLGGKLQPVKDFISFFSATKYIHLPSNGQLIYHLAIQSSWETQIFSTSYAHDSLAKEGFIHASTKELLLETCNKYYHQGEVLVLLTIIPERLEYEVKYEYAQNRNAHFPHIYGAINKTAIQSAVYVQSEEELKGLM